MMSRKRGRPRLDESQPSEENVDDIILIKEFEKHPEFYDRKHPNYRCKKHLDPKWVEIAEALDLSVPFCKVRMLQLRNRYYVERRRLEVVNPENPNATSTWPMFDYMTFLDSHIKPRKGDTLCFQITESTSDNDDVDEDSGFTYNNSSNGSDQRDESFASIVGNIKRSNSSAHLCETNEAFNESVDNGVGMFKAFGHFIASSLIQMDEKNALGLVAKFTTDLIKIATFESAAAHNNK